MRSVESRLFSPCAGFTIVEIVVVLVILGVLAGVSAPVFSRSWGQDARQSGSARELSLIVGECRSEALRQGGVVFLALDSVGHNAWMRTEGETGWRSAGALDSSVLLPQARVRIHCAPSGGVIGPAFTVARSGQARVLQPDPVTGELVRVRR